MPKSAVFPYGIALKESGAVDIFPAAEVQTRSRDGAWLSLFFVVDSGAAFSALPKSDAPVLGVDLEKCLPVVVGGVAGEPIRGWRHTRLVRIAGNNVVIPMVFIDREDAPRVLGREGVFDLFTVIFDESRRRSGFLGESTRERRIVSRVLDGVKSK